MQVLYPKSKEQLHLDNLERLRAFRPIDDTFMRCMFRNNVPLAQFVLQTILGRSDLMLISCETQADMKRVTGAKSVCLDAYAADSIGKKYDIEVQRDDVGADPHRARYNSSAMDVENLDEGQDFTELPDTYVIFITEFDYFEAGEPVYMIHEVNVTTSQLFDDGRHILYVNGEYRGDSDIGKLMHDFCCSDPDKMYFGIMADKARYLKESREGVSEMCKAMEDLRNEGVAEGIEIGREEGREDGMRELALKLRLRGDSIEDISELVGYSPEIVTGWLKADATAPAAM